MFYSPEELEQRAQEYCKQHNLKLEISLGHGMQGIVFATNRDSAIKIHAKQPAYARERDAYLRLSEEGVSNIRGLIVPSLLRFDDNLLIIEMSLVSPPFIVDFGGAYLDGPAPYGNDSEDRERWIQERREHFGDDWQKVNAILADLEKLHGIFVSDVNKGNIKFSKFDEK